MTSDLEALAVDEAGSPPTIEGFRMSPLQIALWRQGAGDGQSFIAWLRAELRSLPERRELEANLRRSIDRHEILRTRFAVAPGLSEPLQCIEPAMPSDLRWYGAGSAEDALALLDADRLRPFDLARGPMVRASVADRGDGSGWLQIALPAVVIDREGLGILFAELGAPALDNPVQYADAAAWLDELLSSPDAAPAREHWRRQGPLSTVDLRLPERRPAAASSRRFRPRRLRRRLGSADRLSAAAGDLGASEEDLLLAAWFGLVGRATECWDLTLGVLVRGRGTADLAGALGPFDRYLPVRVELSPGATLAWAAAEVSRRFAAARSHSEFFSWDLFPEWPGAFAPIAFDVDFDLPDSIERDATLDRFAARASIRRVGEGLETTLSFDPEQYEEAALSALLEAWTTFFESACDRPEGAFGELPLGGPEVHRRLVADFNRIDPSPQVSLLASIARQAARNGDSRAVVCGSEAITYAELEARSDRLAGRLQALGIGPDALAALFLPRSAATVVALVAVQKAGGAYLPIEIETPAERVAWILADSGAALVIADRSTADRLPPGTRWLDPELSESDDGVPPLRRIGPIDAESLAYVIYTSGSTGRPKGVMVTHRGLSNYLGWSCISYGSYGSALAHSPLAFDLTVTSVLTPLATGATVRLLEGADGVESLAEALCGSEEPGLLKITPAHLEGLSDLLPPEGAGAARVLVIGGEALRFESLAFWRGGAVSPRLFNEYGPTETVVGCCVHQVVAGDPATGPVPIGRPIGGASLYLLDGQGELLPEGFRGELFIGGAGVARGYVGRPDLTAWSFPPDPFSAVPGARLYRTGDLAVHRTDGELEFVGRIDDQVKLRGHRIELGEIEAVLAEHPAVARAAVLLERSGPAPRLIAYVSPTDAVREAELKEHLAARLSAPMVPAEIFLLPDLPLTRNGKVDRRALAALPKERPARRRWAPPRNEIERRIAAVWRELLQVERVGIHDGFFELGGDSILSIQAVSRMNRQGIRLTPRQLFAHQTIAELAPLILATEEAPADFDDETGQAPLSPMERWFLELEVEDPHHFNQSLLLAVKEPDPQAIRHAVARILAQHDALRLRFERSEGVWHQRIEAVPPRSPFGQVDLAGLPQALRQGVLLAGCESLQAGLDLVSGPVFRAALFRLPSADARLMLLAHHLAVDVVSWWTVLDDLERAAAAFQAGRPFEGATGSATFARAARAMERRALAPEAAADVAWWVARSPREVPPLPWDGNPPDRVGDATTVSVSLSSEATRSLLTEANRPYRTRIQELLVTALALALIEWTGEAGILLDLEGHGRDDLDDLDLSRTVGWFTAIYPLWLEPGRASDPGAAIRAIKESMRSVPKGGVGFGRLRYLGDEASRAALARLPKAEAIFNYLGQVDRAIRADGPFAPAAEPSGASRSPRQRRPHPLSILGVVAGGRLELSFEVAAGAGREAAVARLARRTVEWLGAIVEHCSTPEAGAYTAADFPGVRLNERSLDRLRRLSPAIDDLYRLTPLQQGLLFHSLADPDSGVYAERMVGVLRGRLDQTAFAGAWREVIARHGILRTAFVADGVPEPLQAVLHEAPFEIAWRDLRGFEPSDQRRIFDQLLDFDRSRPFDLARPPLLRLTLHRESDDAHRFLWSHHHLVLDGWSSAIVLEEILTSYLALAAGGEPDLERPRPYGGYVAWLESRDHREAERVWRAALEGLPGSSFLGAPLRKEEGERFGEVVRRLGAVETQALDRFARGRGLTNNTLVQGGWALLLGRWLGSDDLVFGATSSNRPAELPDIERMVGVFINTLPVRARLPLELSLGSWLRTLQDEQVSLREFDFAALPQIQAWAGLPSGQALFDTLLVFENYPLGELLEAGRQRELRLDEARPLDSTHYPVTLIVTPGRELGFRLLYERSRIEAGTATRWLEQLAWLLSRLPVLAGLPVGALSILTPAERQAILAEDNDTAAGIDDEPLHLKIAREASRVPDAIAVECCGQFLSYGELARRSGRLSGYLKGLGVQLDDRVGLCLHRGPDLAVAVLGILGAGAGYVPLDPAYPRERIAMMIEDCGARRVVAERATASALAPERAVLLDRDGEAIGGALLLPPIGAPDGLSYLIYTSGSTGRPKGVAMTHRALANLVAWQLGQWPRPGQRILQFASPSFDVSFQELFSAWAAGGTLVMVDEESRRDPDLLVRRIETLEVTRLFVPFVMLELFAEAAARRPEVPRSLIEVVTAGEQLRLSSPVAALFRNSGLELHNQYGPSETHVVTAWRLDKRSDEWPELPPIGRPIANVRLYLLDGGMRLLSPGALGEIYLGGVALARGYFDRPSLTAERFVPDAFSGVTGARLYRTGDLGRRLEDGAVEFLGRSDLQVKIRGFRVELAEIEQELARHPGIATAVVTASAAKPGGGVLTAHFVANDVTDPSAHELRSFLASKLPEFMLPASFVRLDRFPMTPSGKVDRRALAASSLETQAAAGSSLNGPVEELLAEIWTDLLGSRPGRTDDFFASGGHSLVATRLVSRVRDAFETELPLRCIFERPRFADLAAEIDRHRAAGAGRSLPPIGRADRALPLPLSFGQRRLWFLDRLSEGTAAYNLPFAVRLRGALDESVLAASFGDLVLRHEVLRMVFREVDGEPIQVVLAQGSFAAARVDLHALPSALAERSARNLASRDAERPFDLAEGPLVRVLLMRIGAQERFLALTLHHATSDGVSMVILFEELVAFYAARISGGAAALPDLQLQYADFASWQRGWLSGEVLGEQLGYWVERLKDAPAELNLRRGKPRPAAGSKLAERIPLHFDRDLATRLSALCGRLEATPFMVLLSAFNLFLAHLSGQRDLMVGTPVANRRTAESEKLIGFFVNTLVLRQTLAGDLSFSEVVAQTRATALDAWSHQDLPFERLVEALHPDRFLDRSPFFQVWFVLQGSPPRMPSLPGLELEPEDLATGLARHDLVLNLIEVEGCLYGSFEFRADLWRTADARRYGSVFEALLHEVVVRPELRLERWFAFLAKAEEDWQKREASDFRDEHRNELKGLGLRRAKPKVESPSPVGAAGTNP